MRLCIVYTDEGENTNCKTDTRDFARETLTLEAGNFKNLKTSKCSAPAQNSARAEKELAASNDEPERRGLSTGKRIRDFTKEARN